jgi:uncharacterized protein (DUF924 family)
MRATNNVSMTDEERSDFAAAVHYAVAIQYGELPHRNRIKGIENVLRLHVEQMLTNRSRA